MHDSTNEIHLYPSEGSHKEGGPFFTIGEGGWGGGWQAGETINFTVEDVKGQSKKGSVVEITVNLLVGILTGWAANMLILPLFGFDVKGSDSLIIVLVFTAISFIRGYCVRRTFNWWYVRGTT